MNEALFGPLYASALESSKWNPLLYDETAVRVIDAMDYDFAKHGKKQNEPVGMRCPYFDF